MGYVVEVFERPSLEIKNSDDLYPVRRIYCVGRNYADHALEMGGDPTREAPFYFTKPADAILKNGSDFPYPPMTDNLHYEAELVVAIGKEGKNVTVENALEYVFGYAVGIDFTRRDLQAKAKKKGRPWDTAKGFDYSAPCTELYPVSEFGHVENARIWLSVNGETKQDSNTNKMIWSVAEVVSNLSELYTLKPGDLIYTGTPEGVGPVVSGDDVRVGIDGLSELEIKIV